jgi:hypothetical protein
MQKGKIAKKKKENSIKRRKEKGKEKKKYLNEWPKETKSTMKSRKGKMKK